MAELGTVVALIKSMSGADPAVIEQAVQDWLNDHPEATTTVQDGSITEAKLAQDVLAELGEIEELKEAIEYKADMIVSSASGAVASFKDGANGMQITSLVIQIKPTQSGTGTPSPTNIREIVGGATGCNIMQSGEDTTDPETVAISWESTAGTVYMGTLDVITGVMTVTHAYRKFVGASDESWNISNAPGQIATIKWPEVKKQGVTLCNMTPPNVDLRDSPSYGEVWNNNSSYNIRTHIIDEDMSVANFKSWLSTHPLELVCPLVEPLTFSITGIEMETLFGVNNIWTNVGDIAECIYYSDTKGAIEKEVDKALEQYRMYGRRTCAIFKKVGVVGDSYAAGYIMGSSGVAQSNNDYSWVKHLENITGREYVNFGVSGATTAGWLSSENGLEKAQIAANKCQAYVVGLQINDADNQTTIGTTADIGTSANTYIANQARVIDALFAINNNAHVFVLTQPKNYIPAWRNAIKDVVAWYQTNGTHQSQVHLIDLADYQPNFREAGCWDSIVSGHFTPVGYEYAAEIIEYAWSKYLNEHPLLFQDVNLIPYGTSN